MVCSSMQYAVGTSAVIPEAAWYLVLCQACSHQLKRFLDSLLQKRLGRNLELDCKPFK